MLIRIRNRADKGHFRRAGHVFGSEWREFDHPSELGSPAQQGQVLREPHLMIEASASFGDPEWELMPMDHRLAAADELATDATGAADAADADDAAADDEQEGQLWFLESPPPLVALDTDQEDDQADRGEVGPAPPPPHAPAPPVPIVALTAATPKPRAKRAKPKTTPPKSKAKAAPEIPAK